MDNLPSGWVKRRSGIIVPRPKRHRAPAVGGLVIAAVLLASPVANGVSDLAHAAVDVVTLVRALLAEMP